MLPLFSYLEAIMSTSLIRFNPLEELTKALRCDTGRCAACHKHGLFDLAVSELLDRLKAEQRRARQIRRAVRARRGNVIQFPTRL
jgi:hypothetical protein